MTILYKVNDDPHPDSYLYLLPSLQVRRRSCTRSTTIPTLTLTFTFCPYPYLHLKMMPVYKVKVNDDPTLTLTITFCPYPQVRRCQCTR